MPEDDVFILSAVRTPIGKIGKKERGILRDFSAVDLGETVVREAVERAGIEPTYVDEVIMGNVLSAGLGQGPARQVAIRAGIPVEKPAYIVNMVCGSGLKAVISAAQAIKAGDAYVIVAGGMESMTNAPFILNDYRLEKKFSEDKLVDTMLKDGLTDAFNDFHMIKTADFIARKYGLTREEIDEFAFRSHMRAYDATKTGRFGKEIIPIRVGSSYFYEDEGIRPDTTVEKLAKLRPIYTGGTTTVGNASQLSDGASALVIASGRKVKELGIDPLARIVGYSFSGVEPESVMESPVLAVKELLRRYEPEIKKKNIIYEHNEAFASASLLVQKKLHIDPNMFNVYGGAVANGHPLGATGAKITTTALSVMEYRECDFGIVTLCIGGGNGSAILLERR